MDYDLSRENQIYLFDKQVEFIRQNKKLCSLKVVKKKRTNTQNAALHKWFELISNSLNEIGLTYKVTIINEIDHPFTPEAVKTHIIKPIIQSMYNYKSTTQLKTNEIDVLIDTISNWLGSKGVHIPFPSIKTLIDYYYG